MTSRAFADVNGQKVSFWRCACGSDAITVGTFLAGGPQGLVVKDCFCTDCGRPQHPIITGKPHNRPGVFTMVRW